MAKAIGKPRRSPNQHKLAKRKASKVALSLLAVFVTLIPLFSAGVWAKKTFFSDQRLTFNTKDIQVVAQKDPVKLFDEAIVSVTFDDGWESVYSQGAKLFRKHGVRTTQYIMTGTFDYPNYLSRDQIRSMQAAGHDIQSHTVSHRDLTTLTNEEMLLELNQSKSDLSKLLEKEVTDFASPLNRYNTAVIDGVKQVYRSHRNTEADVVTMYEGSFNTRANFNLYQISAFSVRRTTTLEQIEAFIEAAKEQKAWILFIYHQLDEKSEDYYAVSPQTLDQHLGAIAKSGLKIATVDEVLDVYESGQRGN